jgi:hypothetical protein
MNREEALEAAKLAKMIGSQLNVVDQMSVERSNNPANKININEFIAKVQNPNASFRSNNYLTNVPAGFAPPPPEDYIQSMIPDNSIGSKQPLLESIPPQIETVPLVTVSNIPLKLHPEPKETKTVVAKNETTVLTRSDVDSIRNSLKSIDKTLAGMLKFLQENSKPKANE